METRRCRAVTLPIPFLLLSILSSGILAPPASAQYAVGTQDVTFYDPVRQRSVPADLYYPALAPGSGQPPADPPPGGFPAVSVGHGYLMGASLYAWLAADLAAHGFVTAVARTGGELFPSHGAFGLDLAFLTRALKEEAEDPASPFFGRIGARTAVMGHSMGGGSSFLAAAGDPQITAVAGFAPAETDPSAIAACAQITRPVLIFAGGNDCVTPPADHQIPMYEALPEGWRTLITLGGASHCQFAAYSWTCSLGEGSCPPPTLSRSEQQDLALTLLRPWLQAVLLDDAAAEQSFQQLLETTPGLDVRQEGQIVTAAPPARLPSTLRLVAAGGNPFHGRLELELASEREGAAVIEVFDVAGRLLRTLPASAPAGRTVGVVWDGRDAAGRPQPAGVYLVRARMQRQESWLRVLRLR